LWKATYQRNPYLPPRKNVDLAPAARTINRAGLGSAANFPRRERPPERSERVTPGVRRALLGGEGAFLGVPGAFRGVELVFLGIHDGFLGIHGSFLGVCRSLPAVPDRLLSRTE
jgi:hypothetical protein